MGVDSAARNPEFQRLIRLQTEAFAKSTLYHSLELLDGTVIPGIISVENLRARLNAYPLPEDLRGKRVLDIGAASGWNSFECERRGAEVVAFDYVDYEEFTAVKRLRESKIEYAIAEIEELTPERFGFFDYVLFFGVFYHLRHPLFAMENVCSVTRGQAFIESYVIDDKPDPERCYLEFYETDELGGQIDNWCGPTTACLMAMARSAGFPRVDLKYVDSRRGGLVAHRRWQPVVPEANATPPFLCSAVNNRHNDIVFQPRKDEYLCLAFLYEGTLSKEDVLVEVDQYGVPALVLVRHEAGYWQVNCKVPPGISPGDHDVRVGTKRAGFSEPVRIRMLPSGADRRYGETPFVPLSEAVPSPAFIRVENTMDRSTTFRGYRNETLACRFTHSDNRLDLSKVQLTVGGNPHPLLSVEQPEPGTWQINARLKGLRRGEHQLRLRTAQSPFSAPFTIAIDPAFDLS
ncbi:MAG: tRNA (mo5U34)-methyltransferase [Bryobacterales bacterium]|nr:tRNA (mo5U34)-methyltransferase [Bryobacterales bacterium]